jgi:hypothetical protein
MRGERRCITTKRKVTRKGIRRGRRRRSIRGKGNGVEEEEIGGYEEKKDRRR